MEYIIGAIVVIVIAVFITKKQIKSRSISYKGGTGEHFEEEKQPGKHNKIKED